MKNNKGFTLIELMIVIAIIAIIAAIAIPNLLASRIRANEATAISALKQIATAQVTFQAGRQGRNTANTVATAGPMGFCSNYRNLAFGRPVGDTGGKLALISDVVGNAAIDAGGGITPDLPGVADGTNGKLAALTPYQGYRFGNDVDIIWSTNFASYTVPELGGTSGNNNYWVGQQGTVYIMGVTTGTAAAVIATGDSPTSTPIPTDWTTL